MQSAVLEFDEAVQVPWRPPLAVVSGTGRVLHLRPATLERAASRPGAPAVARSVPVRASAAEPRGGAAPHEGHSAPRPAPHPAAPQRATARPGRCPAGRRSVRLTRRGRLLLVVLSVAVGLALGALLDSLAGGAGQGSLRLAGDNSVVVRQGDSLWSIATSVAGSDDVRTVVDQIQRLNHLRGTQVQPGQTLQLP